MNFRNLSRAARSPPAATSGSTAAPAAPCDLAAVLALDVFSRQLRRAGGDRSGACRRAAALRRASPPSSRRSPRPATWCASTAPDSMPSTAPARLRAPIAAANTCRPLRGNCVFDRPPPAEVVAVTPTMLVVRAPFTCVAPVHRRRRARAGLTGFGRAPFCTPLADRRFTGARAPGRLAPPRHDRGSDTAHDCLPRPRRRARAGDLDQRRGGDRHRGTAHHHARRARLRQADAQPHRASSTSTA